MDFGRIIKRSWQITWRYKAMWVLGIFAGITGCQPGGGGSGGGGGGGGDMQGLMDGEMLPGGSAANGLSQGFAELGQWLPAIIAAIGVLVLMAVVWSILGVAARGGLVTGVDAAENGSKLRAGEMWGAGFGRFWSLVGVDILLVLPMIFLGLALAVVVIVPVVGAIAGGGGDDAALAAIVPVCGALGLGIPLLLIAGFILGIMHPIAVRYVMLGGQGAGAAVANSWRFFRARVKDTVLMWLLSGALNLAASFALAIPVIVIALGLGVGMGGMFYTEQWGLLVGLGGAMLFLIMVVSIAYSAVWGTFTSALWTLFFREMTGMGTPVREARPELEVRESSPAPPMAPSEEGPGA